jgi:hypothetical protein
MKPFSHGRNGGAPSGVAGGVKVPPGGYTVAVAGGGGGCR